MESLDVFQTKTPNRLDIFESAYFVTNGLQKELVSNEGQEIVCRFLAMLSQLVSFLASLMELRTSRKHLEKRHNRNHVAFVTY